MHAPLRSSKNSIDCVSCKVYEKYNGCVGKAIVGLLRPCSSR